RERKRKLGGRSHGKCWYELQRPKVVAERQDRFGHWWNQRDWVSLSSLSWYAIVAELAGLGASVHTCSRNEKELNERVEEWRGKGFQVRGSVCDLTCNTQKEELIKTVSSVFDGKLNILVNNAATVVLKGVLDHRPEDCSYVLKANLESPYHLCQLAHPLLKASGDGNIVFLSSIAGVVALPALSIYSASKGAINQLTKNLACEWAKDNIRINTVAPGPVKTTITKPVLV
ncbi:hypothetical protein EUGRSUZ_G00287, partial [Eucalyptus grandis]